MHVVLFGCPSDKPGRDSSTLVQSETASLTQLSPTIHRARPPVSAPCRLPAGPVDNPWSTACGLPRITSSRPVADAPLPAQASTGDAAPLEDLFHIHSKQPLLSFFALPVCHYSYCRPAGLDVFSAFSEPHGWTHGFASGPVASYCRSGSTKGIRPILKPQNNVSLSRRASSGDGALSQCGASSLSFTRAEPDPQPCNCTISTTRRPPVLDTAIATPFPLPFTHITSHRRRYTSGDSRQDSEPDSVGSFFFSFPCSTISIYFLALTTSLCRRAEARCSYHDSFQWRRHAQYARCACRRSHKTEQKN